MKIQTSIHSVNAKVRVQPKPTEPYEQLSSGVPVSSNLFQTGLFTQKREIDTYSALQVRWALAQMPLRVLVEPFPGDQSKLDINNLYLGMSQAIAQWTAASLGRIRFCVRCPDDRRHSAPQNRMLRTAIFGFSGNLKRPWVVTLNWGTPSAKFMVKRSVRRPLRSLSVL